MRKFIFFLLLLPIFASLGHDLYIFQQNPDKGFHLSALGALWDKYHKESHDQWKNTVREVSETVGETVEDLTPEILLGTPDDKSVAQTLEETVEENKPGFMEEFTQSDSKDGETKTTPLQKEDKLDTETDTLMKYIGVLLEQKALFIFSALAALAFILNAFFSWVFKPRSSMDEIKSIKRKKRKGGGYAYGRK
tara:strand:+ start:10267 stop:10845 length:579 start_codon:yes stop_codon:yes gene_type:complete